MGNIVVLDELTVNKIAAGEVIERPASVIKELVENSLDAGSTAITVEIRRGGITYIRVTDNGSGITEDDALLAFEKHATSKIRTGDDLDAIMTLGFRGEALASIAAVSRVELSTRTSGTSAGTKVVIHGGALVEDAPCGCPQGTTFIIRDLFFNTPARFKFLKKDATEAGHIIDVLERMALSRPDVSFRLINSGSEVLRSPGDGSLKSAVFSVYGRDITNNIKEMQLRDKGIEITGFAGNIETGIAGRGRQTLFINGRYIRSRIVTSAVDEAYKTLMMKGKYPFIIVNINVNPQEVDVNVHPTKMDVRFSEEGTIFRAVYGAITNALLGGCEKPAGPAPDLPSAKPVLFTTPVSVQPGRKEAPVQIQMPLKEMTASYISEIKKPADDFNSEVLPQQPVKIDSAQGSYVKEVPEIRSEEPVKYRPEAPEAHVSVNNEDNIMLSEAQYIGQAFNTYIILQHGDEMVFIDQHAAHERILFEELKKNSRGGGDFSQMLMTPVVIEMTRSEYTAFQNNKQLFTDMGFVFEEFGANSVITRALPVVLDASSAKSVVIESLRNIMDDTFRQDALNPQEALYDIACKAAIKANKKLDIQEVRELLRKMQQLANPLTCPHGRPLSFRLSKKEMEKRFKRIV